MRWTRLLGVLVMLAAVVGSVAAIRATGELQTAADERSAALDGTLAASTDALRTADDTIAIVSSVVGQLTGSLGSVEDALLDSIRTMDDAEDAVGKLAEIVGEDLPSIVVSLQEAMPALIQVADVIDGTLDTLSNIGVRYNPEVPFDESLAKVAESIEGLPEELDEQAALIDEVAEGLGQIADEAGEIIIDLGAARVQLADGLVLLDQYRATTASAIEEVDSRRDQISAQNESEQAALGWLAVALVITQFGLFVAGAWLTFRKLEAVVTAPPVDGTDELEPDAVD